MVVIKSCRIEPKATLAQLSEEGVVDKRFASLAEGAAFPIEILHKDELDAMRALLFGEIRMLGV